MTEASELSPREAAEQALFWGAVNFGIKTFNDDARRRALRALAAAEIGQQRVLDAAGEDLGTVSWKPGTASDPAVTDEQALLRWVKRNRPGEIVVSESVRPSYVDWLIANAKTQPERVPIDPETGAVVPGVTVPASASEGRLTVRATPAAKERVKELLQSAAGGLRELRGTSGGNEESGP